MSQLELARARARAAQAQSAQPQRPPMALQQLGPFPGYIPRDLYDMGAIARRPQEGALAIPAGVAGQDAALSLGSGVMRGATALADLPGQAFTATGDLIASGMERAGIVSPQTAELAKQSLRSGPMGTGSTAADAVDAAAPGARSYEPQTTLGKYAQTVGEFAPAAVATGPAGLLMNGVVPAIASEAAGQATEGTPLEPWARVIAAVGAPTAINIGTKGFRSLFTASQKKPDIETLRATKSRAYNDVDAAGEMFSAQEVDDLALRVKTALESGNYVPGVDRQTDAVVALLERKAGQPLKLGQLDKIRQSLFKRYEAAKNETGILDAIDEIDAMIAGRSSTSELMAAARLANARYKKAELLDLAFQKASDQTASTGSGGNILNKYRQAVTSIINNPKKSKWFSPDEIEAMRAFVQGGAAENVLRRVGKLAPGGNGLMLALNLGAAAVEPSMLAATAAASGAKATADAMATRRAQDLMNMVAGQAPRSASRPNLAPMVPGISALINQ